MKIGISLNMKTSFSLLSSQRIKKQKMSLQVKVMTALKEAMKAKDQTALTALRAVKSALLLAQTESGASDELTEEQELKLLQKLVKQRKDSAAIYLDQGRKDLALPEIDEAEVISQFLPEALSEEEIEKVVVMTIDSIGAEGMKDMGKVMGIVSKELAGQADGKTISNIVRQKLAKIEIGRVAQLNSASDFGSEGWGFESLRGHE